MENEENRLYLAIDLKSFFASVECVERGLDPLTTNLVVADESRTEKTICLAVTPSLKSYGISGRARLFEVIQRVEEVNATREASAPGKRLKGSSWKNQELQENPALALDYIVARPHMSKYVEYSNKIYDIYLRYVAPEDIVAYSIDEVFLDATMYVGRYGNSPEKFATEIVRHIMLNTGITATVGIGTNIFLAKVAMDILAKKSPGNEYGIRMARLDEDSFREQLWDHRPLTDFWQVGAATAEKLAEVGLTTMRQVAACSQGMPPQFHSRALLNRLFGVRAEFLVDHAWGKEPCTIADIKNYQPKSTSISSGQVLMRPYSFSEARTVLREMAEEAANRLVSENRVTALVTLTIGYDTSNLSHNAREEYRGKVVKDHYGRLLPGHSHGSAALSFPTSSALIITDRLLSIYDRIANPELTVRRINISAENLSPTPENDSGDGQCYDVQLNLFQESKDENGRKEFSPEVLAKEKKRQKAMIQIKDKYGRNALFKGTDLLEEATAIERNGQIGGHSM